MITGYNDRTAQYNGLSSDTKPTGPMVANGSIFLEMDTGKVFVYDEENKTWLEL